MHRFQTSRALYPPCKILPAAEGLGEGEVCEGRERGSRGGSGGLVGTHIGVGTYIIIPMTMIEVRTLRKKQLVYMYMTYDIRSDTHAILADVCRS